MAASLIGVGVAFGLLPRRERGSGELGLLMPAVCPPILTVSPGALELHEGQREEERDGRDIDQHQMSTLQADSRDRSGIACIGE